MSIPKPIHLNKPWNTNGHCSHGMWIARKSICVVPWRVVFAKLRKMKPHNGMFPDCCEPLSWQPKHPSKDLLKIHFIKNDSFSFFPNISSEEGAFTPKSVCSDAFWHFRKETNVWRGSNFPNCSRKLVAMAGYFCSWHISLEQVILLNCQNKEKSFRIIDHISLTWIRSILQNYISKWNCFLGLAAFFWGDLFVSLFLVPLK